MNSQDSTALEKSGKAKDVEPTPPKIDAVTLAHLAAQPRFNSLPNSEAISAALGLFSDCQTAMQREDAQSVSEESDKFLVPGRFPMPAKFPASLEDFYRLIVKAKKGYAQPRFRDFLRYKIKADEDVRLSNLPELRKQLKQAEKLLAERGTIPPSKQLFSPDFDYLGLAGPVEAVTKTVERPPTPGSISIEDAIKGMKTSIAEHKSRHFGDNAVEAALDARFNRYVKDGIDHIDWHILCDIYPRWWLPEKTARKRAAGHARAKKYAEAKKNSKKRHRVY